MQYRLPWFVYRLNGSIPTGISIKRYARVSDVDSVKPWEGPIRRLMAARNWTQAELADHAQLRPNTLSEALNGRSPRMETMEKIAAAFQVPLWSLFVSEEQAALLKQSEESQQRLAKQEDLAALVIRELAPAVASAIAKVTQGSAALPGAPSAVLPASDTSENLGTPPAAAPSVARGRLQHRRRSA